MPPICDNTLCATYLIYRKYLYIKDDIEDSVQVSVIDSNECKESKAEDLPVYLSSQRNGEGCKQKTGDAASDGWISPEMPTYG